MNDSKDFYYVTIVGQDFSIKQTVNGTADGVEALHKVMRKYNLLPHQLVRFMVDNIPNRS